MAFVVIPTAQYSYIGLKTSFFLITPKPKFWHYWCNQFYRIESWCRLLQKNHHREANLGILIKEKPGDERRENKVIKLRLICLDISLYNATYNFEWLYFCYLNSCPLKKDNHQFKASQKNLCSIRKKKKQYT